MKSTLASIAVVALCYWEQPSVHAFTSPQLQHRSTSRNIVSDPSLIQLHMSTNTRTPLIAGNWKMNPNTKQEAIDLATDIAKSVSTNTPGDVALFVPYPFIECVQNLVGDKIIVGAEAVVPHKSGAYTAGVSPAMLKSLGVTWCLAGHSERRALFNEDDENVNSQIKLLIEEGMNVVLCIGETAEEFENKLTTAICEVKVRKGLAGITAEDMKHVTLVYQPEWAIGTGKAADPNIAQSTHSFIRGILQDKYGSDVAASTRILYGGSVGPESVDNLLAESDIDGTLVGGASLTASTFARIINFIPTSQYA